MQTFIITPPNTCCLTYQTNSIVFVQNWTDPIEVADDVTFEEFLTPDDALARAKGLDPNYDSNIILGPLELTPVSYSDLDPVVSKDDDVTMYIEVTCSDPAATITYTWYDPEGQIIPGATTGTYTILQVKESDAGKYICQVAAENEKGQTGGLGPVFNLTVLNNQGSGIG
jgi:hypothetical protein